MTRRSKEQVSGLIGNVADLRITLAGGVTGTAGVNGGTTVSPQVNRTGLSLANLANTFYLASVNAVNSPLPVTLVSFTASVTGGIVDLDWETASEINSDHFTVQRSAGGTIWENILKIKASGNSNLPISYTAYDAAPYSGISFYRLIETDLDGNIAYSSILSVDIAGGVAALGIYPNPATDHLSISFPVSGNYKVSILNSVGQAVGGPVRASGNGLYLNVSYLDAGIYFI